MKTEEKEIELAFLNRVTSTYKQETPYLVLKREISLSKLFAFKAPHHRKCLALGCGDGFEAAKLAEHFAEVQVIDGSTVFLEQCRALNLKNTTFHHGLFEDVDAQFAGQTFDCIVASYVLEHVIDPNLVLRKVRPMLTARGFLYAAVPNAHALSRQLAVRMGFLENAHALTENDHGHGHRRVYDFASFHSAFASAGYTVKQAGGIIVKPLADFQMDLMLASGIIEPRHVWKLDELAAEYGFLCDSLFVIAA